MTTPPLFPGFDGLMTLSRREGVDISPTLLRVLTDLYVQASAHSERRSAAICRTDLPPDRSGRRRDARGGAGAACDLSGHAGRGPETTRAEARRSRSARAARAAKFPQRRAAAPPVKPPTEAQLRMASNLSMQPKDAAEINDMFFGASASERALILHNLAETPLQGFGADSRRARGARHRDAGDGRVRRRHRKLHAGARRNPDLAGEGRQPRWSTIPAASRWPARPRRWTCRARFSSGCCCSSSPNSALR